MTCLTPGKKPIWIFIYSFLTGEQAGLDTEATTYGITTEKTNYDTAISTLTTYLATLTTPVPVERPDGQHRHRRGHVPRRLQRCDGEEAGAAQQDARRRQGNGGCCRRGGCDNEAQRQDSASATSPSNILTASDAGTDATITIASHTRLYGDATSLSVTGGSITGLAIRPLTASITTTRRPRTRRRPITRLPRSRTRWRTSPLGRHYCGQVTTPASGGGSTSGSGAQPPQGSGPYP
jgi:hypothetical protein